MAQVEEQIPETQTDSSSSDGGNKSTKKGMGGCLLILFLLLMLIIGGLAVTYVLTKNKSNDRFNGYIDQATEQGISLRVHDVVERYFSASEHDLDTTSEWSTTIEEFGSEEYISSIKGVPFLGVNVRPKWPPNDWKDIQECSRFVKERRRDLIRLQLATAGFNILAPNFGPDSALTETDFTALDRAWDFLVLSCYVAAHDRDLESLTTRLVACLNFGKCCQRHPAMIARCLDYQYRAMELVMVAASSIEFSVQHIDSLANGVEPLASWTYVQAWWEYERAVRLLMYNDIEKFRETEVFKSMANDPNQSDFIKNLDNNIKLSPYSGEDAIAFLEKMRAIETLFLGNPLDQATRIQEAQEEIWNESFTGLAKYKQPTARFMVPPAFEIAAETGRVGAIRNVLLAVLAMDHERGMNRKFSQTLDEATDGFLVEVPIDLYTNEDLIVKHGSGAVKVYSVGPNRKDDRLGDDDIGATIRLEKWDATEGGARKIE